MLAFYELMQHVGHKDKVYLFIKSHGGDGKASLRIVHLMRQYTKKIHALIPLESASAATMIALGADDIQMGPLAYLTAVDTALTHDLSPVDNNNDLVSVSQDELQRVIRLWKQQATDKDSNPYECLYGYVHPLVIGAIDRISSLSIQLCKEILSYHIKDEKLADTIADRLNSAYPSHSYPITIREAKKIGLSVKPLPDDLNDLLLDLNEMYSEMGQRALTDFDEQNYHNNEILNILEGPGIQIFYQNDKDWHYRAEERRWVPMNDNSAWHKYTLKSGKVTSSRFHVR
ncbi:MAG: hypothetical protein R3F11_26305 [Verrucomicrobiales bacterium]